MLAAGAEPDIRICVTHALFTDDAVQRLDRPEVTELVITDTVPLPADKQRPKIKVLSVAPLLGEAIRRIHEGESVSALFDPKHGSDLSAGGF
jgi:ribose-phosphate pyrophosphokinase